MAPRPTGVSGADIEDQGQREAQAYQMSEEERIERDARVERNSGRDERRENGEEDVSDDEDVIPPFEKGSDSRGEKSPEPESGAPREKAAHTSSSVLSSVMPSMLGAIATLSPGTLIRVNGFVQSLTGRKTAAIPEADERAVVKSSRRNRSRHSSVSSKEEEDDSEFTIKDGDAFLLKKKKAPEPILALLRACYHLPLTVCTNEALKEIRTNTKNRYVKLHNSSSKKRSLIDVGQWGDEKSIDVEEWHEAWANYLEIMESLDKKGEIAALFREHYDHIRKKDEVKSTFDAVIEFDIEVRQTFFTGERVRFVVGSAGYEYRFQSICNAVTQRLVASWTRQGSSNSKRPREGYQPYNKADRRSQYKSDYNNSDRREGSSNKPFREGRQSGAGLFCLKCGQGAPNGHHARSCRNDKLPNGKPTFAAFQGGRFVIAESGKDLCVFWNLSGEDGCKGDRCSRNNRGAHICSLCGSPNHHGASKRCL
ncbi:hypothetical protein BDY19DRAFT_743824 [Irpex rosettiformis]|uniref:Uncharacterized protein n=2 Tax=Irpex rosettiformis TaxID=378272 RepID=A0ACB8TXA0_9APHY|nr:hypothetical protein BDY19DRAFT_361773 [Irpex rosettiformis]KAI0090895.1 hypothetical protein BDY19DRAFT_743824 [Irpex rosettiformis]